MRFPIKFKMEVLSATLRRLLSNQADPVPLISERMDAATFSLRVSSICIDGVWKTTRPTRHVLSNQLLRRHLGGRTGIFVLDVGVSDGVTCTEFVELLGTSCARFYATDLYFSIRALERKGVWYFYPSVGNMCVMAVTRRLIYYNVRGSMLNPFRLLAAMVCGRAPRPESAHEIALVNPQLRALAVVDARVTLAEWSLFTPWQHEPMDAIRVANVLNVAYFSAARLRFALNNLCGVLVEGGLLCVVENRDVESATLFQKRMGRLVVVERTGAKSDVEMLCEDSRHCCV